MSATLTAPVQTSRQPMGWREVGESLPPRRQGPTFASIYREASARIGGECPIEAGFIGRLVDNECRHERLPFDPDPPCGCFPEEEQKPFRSAPALQSYPISDKGRTLAATAPAITTEEAHALLPTEVATGPTAVADPEAPYGRKADGTPRKRPAPSADTLAKAHAARRANGHAKAKPAANGNGNGNGSPTKLPRTRRTSEPVPQPAPPGYWLGQFESLLRDLEQEAAKVVAARDAVRDIVATFE